MNSSIRVCFAVAIVLAAFVALADADCFDMEKMKEDFAKCRKAGKEAAMKKCAEDNPSNDEAANKKCAQDKFKAGMEKCKDVDKAEKQKCWEDATGVKMDKKKFEMTQEQYEEKILGYVTDSSKTEEIKKALGECKDVEGMKKYMCGMKKVSEGPCPEMKDVMDKMKEKWQKKHEKSEE